MTQAIADPSMPLEQVRSAWTQLRAGLDRVLLGQDAVKERVLTALLAGGHVLVEGPPGTGKTLVALALSRLIGGEFRRIQFTPDLMPVDLLGTNVFEQRRQEFVFVRGPVFTDVLLADEVNRTPPRTQSALLEAMQERAVTVDGQRHTLSPVFFVLATQNPVEYEGPTRCRKRRRTASCYKSTCPTPPPPTSWRCSGPTPRDTRSTSTRLPRCAR